MRCLSLPDRRWRRICHLSASSWFSDSGITVGGTSLELFLAAMHASLMIGGGVHETGHHTRSCSAPHVELPLFNSMCRIERGFQER